MLLHPRSRRLHRTLKSNYRYSTQAPYPGPFLDCARALQYLCLHAGEYNINPQAVAATGGTKWRGLTGVAGAEGRKKPEKAYLFEWIWLLLAWQGKDLRSSSATLPGNRPEMSVAPPGPERNNDAVIVALSGRRRRWLRSLAVLTHFTRFTRFLLTCFRINPTLAT